MRIIISLLLLLTYGPFLSAQSTDLRSYMFGHSLMDHRPPAIPTPSNETTIAHWLHLLAEHAGHSYQATGQYGSLETHAANLPPISQWGYDIVTSPWDSDMGVPFSAVDFNNVLLTALNYVQWQGPGEPYFGGNGSSPISATQDLIDWLDGEEPGIPIYIYENWPDMAEYTGGAFPPDEAGWQAYNAYLNAEYHDWWIEYQDALLASHPDENIRMIPVGPILSDLLTNTVLDNIPLTEVYEDDAPHGRATLYFLASVVTYMAIYAEPVPTDFPIPDIVHAIVRDNFSMLVNRSWDSLQNFNLPDGSSRVFFDDTPPPPPSGPLTDACKLDIGVNLAGMSDFGTELPFVDLMHNARTWYAKDLGGAGTVYYDEYAAHLSYRPDGYPTQIPQTTAASPYPQAVATIWGDISGWPTGEYVILWEGTGELQFIGTVQDITNTATHRATFQLPAPVSEGIFEITILESDVNDPIRNIRLIMPGHEATYASQPFNPDWLSLLQTFNSVRFMDWGQTNNWGHQGENWLTPELFDWSERAQMDHYTWAFEKGVPYEMMVRLMNDYELDGWVCVPHRASLDYITGMATYFRDNLDPERHLTVEFGNEIWNFLFQHTQWLNYYACEQTGGSWPACYSPYVQDCMDIWTDVFDGQMDRITRVLGGHAGNVGYTQALLDALSPGTVDAISPTFYFGLSEDSDTQLDAMGSSATATDLAAFVRADRAEYFSGIADHQTLLAEPRGLELVFYEGGHHITPHPIWEPPSYEQALLDIQRDTAMFNLYQEWFDMLRGLQTGEEPLKLMHFSFVAPLSAQYGSWGLLESMYHDTSVLPAPKYEAVLANRAGEDCAVAAGPTLAVRIILEGPRTGMNGSLMRTSLAAEGHLPLREPYTTGISPLFASVGQAGGETITASVASANLGTPDAIVDWVFLELRDATNPSQVLASRSALLQSNGDIVDVDGVSALQMPYVATGDYYVAIHHRNHLGIMTANSVALGLETVTIDFVDGSTTAYGSHALKALNGQWVLMAGDANANGQIQNTDIENVWKPTVGQSGYQPADFNLNGQVQNTDLELNWKVNVGRGTQLPN